MKIQRRFAPTGGLFEPDSVACFPGMRIMGIDINVRLGDG